MPSPFPGMDPYFEGDLWTTFHTQLGVDLEIDYQRPPEFPLPREKAAWCKKRIRDWR